MTAGERGAADDGADAALVFTVTLTERGYRRVLIHLAALKLRFLPPALTFGGMYAYAAGGRVEGAGLFLAAIALPVTLWGYLSWVSGSPRSRALYEPISYEFGPEEIAYHSPDASGAIGWERVTRWREAAGHILLYVSGAAYVLVPVEELDDVTRARLRDLLTQRVGPARRVRRMR
ncbi:MAG TPA: YcxB family protein [Coriobacteriia bacterium]|nr:YcxB family protein [Coriobacteriia bacterium]